MASSEGFNFSGDSFGSNLGQSEMGDFVNNVKKMMDNVVKHSTRAASQVEASFGKKIDAQMKKFKSVVQSNSIDSVESLIKTFKDFQKELKSTSSLTEKEAKKIGNVLSKGLREGLLEDMRKTNNEMRKIDKEYNKQKASKRSGTRKDVYNDLVGLSRSGDPATLIGGSISKVFSTIKKMAKNSEENAAQWQKSRIEKAALAQSVSTHKKYYADIISATRGSMAETAGAHRQAGNIITRVAANIRQKMQELGMAVGSGSGGRGNSGGGRGPGGGGAAGGGIGGGLLATKEVVSRGVSKLASVGEGYGNLLTQTLSLAQQYGQIEVAKFHSITDAMLETGMRLDPDSLRKLQSAPTKVGYGIGSGPTDMPEMARAEEMAKYMRATGMKFVESLQYSLGEAFTVGRNYLGGADFYKIVGANTKILNSGKSISQLSKHMVTLNAIASTTNLNIRAFGDAIANVSEEAALAQVQTEELTKLSAIMLSAEAKTSLYSRMGINLEKSMGNILKDMTTGFQKMKDGTKAFFGMQAFGTSDPFQAMAAMDMGQSVEDIVAGKKAPEDLMKTRMTPVFDMMKQLNPSGEKTSQGLFMNTKLLTTLFNGGLSNETMKAMYMQGDKLLEDTEKMKELEMEFKAASMSDTQRNVALASSTMRTEAINRAMLDTQMAMNNLLMIFYTTTTALMRSGLANMQAIFYYIKGIFTGSEESRKNYAKSYAYEMESLSMSAKAADTFTLASGYLKSMEGNIKKTMALNMSGKSFANSEGGKSLENIMGLFYKDKDWDKNYNAKLANPDLNAQASPAAQHLLQKMSSKHSGGMIPRFHDGGFPGMQGMTSGAILRNDEIFLGGNVGKTGQVLSPQESKNAISSKGVTIQFNGPVYGLPDFKNIVKQIIDQHVGGM